MMSQCKVAFSSGRCRIISQSLVPRAHHPSATPPAHRVQSGVWISSWTAPNDPQVQTADPRVGQEGPVKVILETSRRWDLQKNLGGSTEVLDPIEALAGPVRSQTSLPL